MINKPQSALLDLNDHFKQFPLHEDLQITNTGVLRIRDHSARNDELGFREISLLRYTLPPNSVYDHVKRLVDTPDLLIPAIHALNHVAKTSPPSKSKSNRIAFALTAIIKCIECLWINDFYTLNHIPDAMYSKLALQLSNGGWHLALNIKARLTSALHQIKSPDHPLFCSINNRVSVSNIAFQQALATNISSHEVAVYFNQIKLYQVSTKWLHPSDYVEKPVSEDLKMKYSMLRQTLEAINFLYYVPLKYRPPTIPYREYVRLTKTLTDAPGRTENLDGHLAGKLLESSLLLIYKTSPAILSLLNTAYLILIVHTQKTNGERVKAFEDISHYADSIEFDLATGGVYDVSNIKSINVLNTILRDFLSACFVVIAVFNARRKDEVAHKKLGLYMGSCTTFNSNLRIFELMVYIEKTIKDYAPFYVNDATQRAVSILEQLQFIFSNKTYTSVPATTPDKNTTLFRYKLFNADGLSEHFTPFVFETFPDGQSYHFITKVVKTDGFRATPHMFRRLYCTIWMNQHEYPHLPALSQQLSNGGLAATQIYITEPNLQREAGKLSKVYDWKIEQYNETHETHNNNIQESLKQARENKMSEIVFSILNENKMSGGYAKIVRKFYKKLQKSTLFVDLDNYSKIQETITKLRARGHAAEPFRHAQCLAGANKIKSKSRCWEPTDNLLHKENASPLLCANCPFSSTSENHLANLEEDVVSLQSSLTSQLPDTLEYKHTQAQLSNLIIVINIHNSNFIKVAQ